MGGTAGDGDTAFRDGRGGRLGRVGGGGDEPTMGKSVETDLVAGRSWVANLTAEVPPES